MKPKQRKRFIEAKGKRNLDDSDRNFDDLAHKFSKKVYGELKGRIRLEILKRDLEEYSPGFFSNASSKSLKILDAGAGYGPFSVYLAQMGHQVTLVDHSQKMLDLAQQEIRNRNVEANVQVFHSSIQSFVKQCDTQYDLILCHAVLEWVKEPEVLISLLVNVLASEGLFSVTVYNLHGMIFKNLLRTNYKKVLKKEFYGWPGSLTPTYPLTADQVLSWFDSHWFKLLCHSGMRVFHDYILDLKDKEKSPDTVLKLELEYSRTPPYRDLGRYQHLLFKRDKP